MTLDLRAILMDFMYPFANHNSVSITKSTWVKLLLFGFEGSCHTIWIDIIHVVLKLVQYHWNETCVMYELQYLQSARNMLYWWLKSWIHLDILNSCTYSVNKYLRYIILSTHLTLTLLVLTQGSEGFNCFALYIVTWLFFESNI